MPDVWMSGATVACFGSVEIFRVALTAVRDRDEAGVRRLIAWYALVGVAALAAGFADAHRALAFAGGIGALTGLGLIALAATFDRLASAVRRTGPRRRRFSSELARYARRNPVSYHLFVAAAWAVPLSISVSILLEAAVGFPRTPIFWNVMALTVVGSALTEDRRVLLVGLKFAVALAATTAVAMLATRWYSLGLDPVLARATWVSAATLVFGSALLSQRA